MSDAFNRQAEGLAIQRRLPAYSEHVSQIQLHVELVTLDALHVSLTGNLTRLAACEILSDSPAAQGHIHSVSPALFIVQAPSGRQTAFRALTAAGNPPVCFQLSPAKQTARSKLSAKKKQHEH